MKQTLLLLALLWAGSVAEPAPAPVYKHRPTLDSALDLALLALPLELRQEIDASNVSCADIVQGHMMHLSTLTHTKEQRKNRLACIEKWKRNGYLYPIQFLEAQRKDAKYAGREVQARIEEAIKQHRLHYEDAKKKGLVKEEVEEVKRAK